MKRTLAILVVASVLVPVPVGPAAALVPFGTINAAGGGGNGDGALATDARIRSEDVDVDSAGNLYIVDFARIRKVDAGTGVVSTVAGTGVPGYTGDGGPATAAQIEGSTNIAIHTNGDLYISQSGSGAGDVVRKVDAGTGIITTVAGSGPCGYSGDGGPATAALLCFQQDIDLDAAGNLYIADRANNVIRKVDSGGVISTIAGFKGGTGQSGNGGPATAAQIGEPWGVGVNSSGDVYIGTVFGGQVRRVDNATGLISTVFTTSGRPEGIDFDGADNAYVSDFIEDSITKITPAGVATTFAGGNGSGFSGDGGPATAAQLDNPRDVAVDDADNVYLAANGSNRVRMIDAGTGIIDTVAGGGADDNIPATDSSFRNPFGIATDVNGDLFIADRDDERIRRIDAATGIVTTFAGTGQAGFSGDGGPASQAQLDAPDAVTFTNDGDLLIVDSDGTRLRMVDGVTGVITTIAGTGVTGFAGDGGPATAAEFDSLTDVVVDDADNIYLADRDNNRIRVIDAETGIITTFAGTGIEGYGGDGGPAAAAVLDDPSELAFDPFTGEIAIWDRDNDRVRVVDPGGTITTVVGDGTDASTGDGGPAADAQISRVGGLVFLNGHLLMSDEDAGTVRSVNILGIIEAIVGSGAAGTSGDGGPALEAGFEEIRAIAVGPDDELWIVDEFLIRQVIFHPREAAFEKYVGYLDGVTPVWVTADEAPGVELVAGTAVWFGFQAQNIGEVPLSDVVLTDPLVQAAIDTQCTVPATLEVGEGFTCIVGGFGTPPGQTTNEATLAFGSPTTPLTVTDSANVFGQLPVIAVRKYVGYLDPGVTWDNADTAPGPQRPVGSSVWFGFQYGNLGSVPLSNVTVSDPTYDAAIATQCVVPASLAPGQIETCIFGPFPAAAGLQVNTVTVSGEFDTTVVDDSDSATYSGVAP